MSSRRDMREYDNDYDRMEDYNHYYDRHHHHRGRSNNDDHHRRFQERSFSNSEMSPSSASAAAHRDNNTTSENDVYIVQQKYGYLAWTFSLIQVAILACMMWQCGIAPFNINPMIGPYPDALNYWGAKNAVLILDNGEWWRLFTPVLLHAGIIHLFCNVAVQVDIGSFFEQEWGSLIWLIIYIGSAFGSSILSVDFMPNSVGVGSSGAVCGLFGAKLSEVFCRICERRRTKQDKISHEVRMEQLNGILCSVVVVTLFSFIPYVDWAAHLGGFASGIGIGLIVFSFKIQSWIFVTFWCMVGIASTLIMFIYALQYMYGSVEPADELRDVCDYYKQYFEDYECSCQLNGDNNNNDK